MANIYTLTVSTGFTPSATIQGTKSPIVLSVSTGFKLTASVDFDSQHIRSLRVTAGINLSSQATLSRAQVFNLSVSAGATFAPTLGGTPARIYNLSVATGFAVSPFLSTGAIGNKVVSVSSGFTVTPTVTIVSNKIYNLSVATGLSIAPALSKNTAQGLMVSAGATITTTVTCAADRPLSVSTGLFLAPILSGPRESSLALTAGLSLAPTVALVNQIVALSVSSAITLHPSVTDTVGTLMASAGVQFTPTVACTISLTGPSGLSTPIFRGLSGDFPLTFAETPSGTVLMANGVDPMLRWDAISGVADYAGVQAPSSTPTLTPSGNGNITGRRLAFVRYIDQFGQPSNLSPLGSLVDCGRDGLISSVYFGVAGSMVLIRSEAHGLTGSPTVLLGGFTGLPINGPQAASVVDDDHFLLISVLLAAGDYLGGGWWSTGSALLTYGSIPLPTQSKVTRIQLLRTAEGDMTVAYVDVDSTNLLLASATSVLSDDDLTTRESVSLDSEDGQPTAMRYAVPPANRPVVVNYQGRVFAGGDLAYYAGCVSVTKGQTTIRGAGTKWPASLAGRLIYVRGCSVALFVSSVDVVNQTLVVSTPYPAASNLFATYVIRSVPADRKQLQWSEAANPEAWPPWNSIGLPEDNDEIVGLFVRGTYLFVAERRHIYRYQFSDDPGTSGHFFMSLDRGALNHRVIAVADDLTYLMDESGIYSFDGGNTADPISTPIQVMFQADGLAPTYQIDWSQDTTLWHASVDPVRTIIRWFCSFVGQPPLKNAICYNYRLSKWWVESYPVAITSSTTGSLADAPNVGIPGGSRRALAGSEARSVLVLGEGSSDLAIPAQVFRGVATEATSISLTDSAASFGADLGGVPLSIVSGTGALQQRLISTSTSTTLTIVKEWDTIPDETSVYQVGGIPWEWRSGWWDVEDDESDTPRDFTIAYQPTTNVVQTSVQFYYNHQVTPTNFVLDSINDGVSTTENDPNVWVDFSANNVTPGFRQFRQANHGEAYVYSDSFVQVRLSGVTNSEVIRIYQVTLRGVEHSGE